MGKSINRRGKRKNPSTDSTPSPARQSKMASTAVNSSTDVTTPPSQGPSMSNVGQLVNQSAGLLNASPQHFIYNQQVPYAMNLGQHQQVGQPLYHPPPASHPTDPGPSMMHLTSRLDTITEKLQTLGTIEKTMWQIKTQLETVDKKVDRVQMELKAELGELKSKLNDIEGGVQENSLSIEDLTAKVGVLQNVNGDLKSQVLDLQVRSMRDNLLFYNIPESQEPEEDCVSVILNFCETNLKIEGAKDSIKLDRAHRLGRRQFGKIRPIVAKFNFYPHRSLTQPHPCFVLFCLG